MNEVRSFLTKSKAFIYFTHGSFAPLVSFFISIFSIFAPCYSVITNYFVSILCFYYILCSNFPIFVQNLKLHFLFYPFPSFPQNFVLPHYTMILSLPRCFSISPSEAVLIVPLLHLLTSFRLIYDFLLN